MREEADLRNYILRRFFVVLIFVGVMQGINNALFAKLLGPVIENVFQIRGLFDGASIRESFGLLFKTAAAYIILMLSGGKAYGALDVVIKWVCSNEIVKYVSDRFLLLQKQNTALFLLGAFCCIFVMVVLWLAPYILAGLYFSISVSKRVKKMEQKRLCEEKEQEKQKNLLLSDIAHDIKTPITTIAGFSKALAEGEVSEDKRQEYLDSIYNKSMQTSQLVTLLFEYVKLDSAGYALSRTKEDVFELVREVAAGVYTDFEERKMSLEIDIPETALYAYVDKVQFQRAVRNLLANAYKHNPQETTVSVKAMQQGRQLVITVSDNGNRIDTDVAKHLFDPFVQGDKARTTGKGSGLGLSICRKIIEMHGGHIRLIQYHERPDYVKTFEIKIPLEGNRQ